MANITGTPNDDVLQGTLQPDVIIGLGGNDQILGLAGADVLHGGLGDDEITGGLGADDIFAGAGSDLIAPGRGNDIVRGGVDLDTVNYAIAAGPVDVDLAAGIASDGAGGTDDLRSIEGIIDSPFDDRLRGSDEFNVFFARGGNDDIDGRGGSNRVDYRAAPAGVDVDLGAGTAQDGFGGTDTIANVSNVLGSAFDDVIAGSPDFNVLEGLAGNDQIDGGPGGGRVEYGSSPGGVVVNLAAGTAQDGFGGIDAIVNVQDIRGSAFDDILVGNQAFNLFEPLGGDDVVLGVNLLAGNEVSYRTAPAGIIANLETGTIQDGFGGTDTVGHLDSVTGSAFDDMIVGSSTAGFQSFRGLAGNDTIDGSGGDQVSYRGSPSGVVVDLAAGTAEDGFGTTDTFTGINAVRGSDLADRITGSGAEFENFRPEGGNDVVDGGAGIDRIDYRNSPDPVTVDLAAGTAVGGSSGTDTLAGIEEARGGVADDRLFGSDGANLLIGRTGNDVLDGRNGDDRLQGEANSDTLRGRAGNDQLSGGTGADFLEGNLGADQLSGGAGRDQLFGNLGGDILGGGAGDDLLVGGLGNDRLTGGGGSDTFSYSGPNEGVDRITDLGAGDVIDITQVLSGFQAGVSDPAGFVSVADSGADAMLRIDPDGGANNFSDLAVISGNAGTSLQNLIDAGNLVMNDAPTS
jgi:Ca2+-binding RTX toxin-like protein